MSRKRKSSPKPSPRRRGQKRLGFKDALPLFFKKWGWRLGLVCLLIWGVMLAAAADLHTRTGDWIVNTTYTVTADAGFKLKNIEVTGRTYTDTETLRRFAGIDQGDSLFALRLHSIHANILTLPWVENATVKRAWPDTLQIDLTEKQPLGLWQHGGVLQVIDQNGATVNTPDLEAFSNLPILTGDDAPKHAPDLITLIKAEPLIAEKLDSAVRVGGRRWDLKLKNGLKIKLPEEDIPYALARISEAQRNFLIFSKEIISLDARFSDKMIIKTSSGTASQISDALASALKDGTISVSD